MLLPLLTEDRYHDAQITADYQIRVWDAGANDFRAKSIFSGGTRDQFSLALRLAFALAALPQELGTTPGFIFLDEVMGAADDRRALAIQQLLTRGPIAANFAQVLVISHGKDIDTELFPYHVVLAGGRVVSTNLPGPRARRQSVVRTHARAGDSGRELSGTLRPKSGRKLGAHHRPTRGGRCLERRTARGNGRRFQPPLWLVRGDILPVGLGRGERP